ncbi:MAG TPA: hypothetical protein VJU86_00630 [Pyrinomonadaceae bacterium]|nr:hypothetical protein [Pyrinomonadaceae bacterium]
MRAFITILVSLLAIIIASPAPALGQQSAAAVPKFETAYDKTKNQTTVRMLPVKLSGEFGKYHSLHMSPSFKYPGEAPAKPELIDFELQIVVKGRLKTDLYVVFVIDGEKIFLSSSRWAVMRPVPGRVWMGERLVFRMPYETLLKLDAAKTLEIRMDEIRFEVGEEGRQAIRKFVQRIKYAPWLGTP